MKNQEKSTKKAVIALLILLAVIAVLLCVYRFTRGETSEGQKTVTIHVIHKDQSVNDFEITTTREYLGEVLTDEGLAEGENGPYGMFIRTVDEETADEAGQEWWCITKGGDQLNTSVDQTPVTDGDEYELTLTVGY